MEEYDQLMKDSYENYESVITASETAKMLAADRKKRGEGDAANNNSGGASNAAAAGVGSRAEPVNSAETPMVDDLRHDNGLAAGAAEVAPFAEAVGETHPRRSDDLVHGGGPAASSADHGGSGDGGHWIGCEARAMQDHTCLAKQFTAHLISNQSMLTDRDRTFLLEHQLLGDQFLYVAQTCAHGTELQGTHLENARQAYTSGVDQIRSCPPAEAPNVFVILSLFLSYACFRAYRDPAMTKAMLEDYLPVAQSAVQALPEGAFPQLDRDLLWQAVSTLDYIISDCDTLVSLGATLPFPFIESDPPSSREVPGDRTDG
jgi:hypothetical protein